MSATTSPPSRDARQPARPGQRRGLKIRVIGALALTRLVRDRSNLFFVFLFPMLLVLVIGLQFGGDYDAVVIVVHDGDAAAVALVDQLDAADGLRAESTETVDEAVDLVSRGKAQVAVVVPDGLAGLLVDAEAAFQVTFRPDAQGLRPAVEAAIADVAAPYRAARFAAERTGQPVEDLLAAAGAITSAANVVGVDVLDVGEDELAAEFAGMGQFEMGATSQLVLFVFLTSLAASTNLIEARKLGLARRMLATPTTATDIVLGEGLGRLLVAVVQATYIALGATILFGVSYGDLLGAGAVILAFSAVSAGAATLLGAVASNVNQAGGLAVLASLLLGAVGGSMVPLEIFSDTVRTVAHVTPHAWANDAFAELVRRDGTLADVTNEVAVLVGYAVILWSVAAWRLKQVITRP